MRLVPDHRIRAEKRPRGGRRQVVLTEMDAGGTAERSHIGSVVDDDERIVAAGRVDSGVAQVEQGARFEPFRADLQEGRTAVEECPQQVERRPPGAGGGVGVDDGVKRTQRGSRPLASA